MKESNNQHGFGTVAIIAIVLVIVVVGLVGWLVASNMSKSTKHDSANTSSSTTQSTTNSTTTTQSTQPTYLVISQWGIKLPLSTTISDAYYIVNPSSSLDASGAPGSILLGLKSLDGSGCNANDVQSGKYDQLGAIGRSSTTQTDPVSGQPYTQEYPNGATVGNYYYFWQDATKGKTCASTSTLQNIGSAFAAAAKNIATN